MPKKKVDYKKTPLEAQAILKECTEDELSYMANIATNPNFQTFIAMTQRLINRNMATVFGYSEADPQKLAIFKANARGQVGGLANLIYVIKGSEAEIQRRAKERK